MSQATMVQVGDVWWTCWKWPRYSRAQPPKPKAPERRAADHPLVRGMVLVLPDVGAPVTQDFIDLWTEAFKMNLAYVYGEA